MKYSVRYAEIRYNKRGRGKSILILRGMYIREYSYTSKNAAILIEAASVHNGWEVISKDREITFTRIYP